MAWKRLFCCFVCMFSPCRSSSTSSLFSTATGLRIMAKKIATNITCHPQQLWKRIVISIVSPRNQNKLNWEQSETVAQRNISPKNRNVFTRSYSFILITQYLKINYSFTNYFTERFTMNYNIWRILRFLLRWICSPQII